MLDSINTARAALAHEGVRECVRQFVVSLTRNPSVRDDEDLFKNGHLSSLAALDLVQFVERQLGHPLSNDELQIDNFRSIDAVAQLIATR